MDQCWTAVMWRDLGQPETGSDANPDASSEAERVDGHQIHITVSGWINWTSRANWVQPRPLPPCGVCSMPKKPDTPARLTAGLRHFADGVERATKTVQFAGRAEGSEVTLCWGAAADNDAEGDIIKTSDHRAQKILGPRFRISPAILCKPRRLFRPYTRTACA